MHCRPNYSKEVEIWAGQLGPSFNSVATPAERKHRRSEAGTPERCDRTEETSMEKALRVYGEVLRLVRRLPKDTRPYYAKYARENFVNYRDVNSGDAKALEELFRRAYDHSLWVLNKVTESYFGRATDLRCFFEFIGRRVLMVLVCLRLQYSVEESAASRLRSICLGG